MPAKSPSPSTGDAHSEDVGTCGRSTVDVNNVLEYDYRSCDDSGSDKDMIGVSDEDFLDEEGLNFEETLLEKKFSSEYEKGHNYETDTTDILSDLALSLELICLSTKNDV